MGPLPHSLWQLRASSVAPERQGCVSPTEGSSAVYLPLLLGSLLLNLQARSPSSPFPTELPPLPPTSWKGDQEGGGHSDLSGTAGNPAGSGQVSLSTGSWHLGRAGPASGGSWHIPLPVQT